MACYFFSSAGFFAAFCLGGTFEKFFDGAFAPPKFCINGGPAFSKSGDRTSLDILAWIGGCCSEMTPKGFC